MSRYDKIMQVAWDAHNNGDCDCVTITLSRESAEALHRYYPAEDRPHELELDAALRAVLGER
jgi:hypothetical protein